MKSFKATILLLLSYFILVSHPIVAGSLDKSLHTIKNFHFVSPKLASSGILKLQDYQYIEEYGFKHVVNLIPGNQKEEREHVQSLGLSYEQIEVNWDEPTLQDFETFVSLMKQYKEDKVFVHCEINLRGSTFLFLYRVTQLGVSVEEAKKDLNHIWKPSTNWQYFIDQVLFAYSD
jgi:protein tyrosine phosphatase (PTP) superfamily phosphohydrolase (DUF442 family)